MGTRVVGDNRVTKWDLSGKVFGRLKVLRRVEDVEEPSGKLRPMYECICSCGNLKNIRSSSLRSGATKSCGCLSVDTARKVSTTHGLSSSSTYRSYRHMLERCSNPKEAGFEDYGGRGITVCDRWVESFENFLEDMGVKPENHVIDRIDPDGNYCPNNCRWVDRNTSSYNTRMQKTNTTGRTGVYWFKRVSKWIAAIHYNNKQIHLGYFSEFRDAVKARESAEIKYYGFTKE